MSRDKKPNSTVRKVSRILKWLLPLTLVAGLVVLAFVPQPAPVDAGPVRRGAMQLTVDDDGETRVRERYLISAPLAGRLLRVGLDPGDTIQPGDVLATLDPGAPDLLDPRARAQAEAMVKAAEAGVASAGTQLEARNVEAAQLEKAYLRNRLLHEKGNIADAAHEQSESAYLAAKHASSAAESAVQIARFELEQARAALLRFDDSAAGAAGADPTESWHFVIRSPIHGRVLRVHEESSRVLQQGSAIMEVGDPADLEMRIDVLSQDAVKMVPGQKVIIDHWGGARVLAGRIRLIEPSAFTKVSALGVDEQRVNVIADFDTGPAEGESLGDGYRVEARIIIWEGSDVLQVPSGALFREGSSWAVYRVSDDRARLVTIELGRNNGEVAEVLSGLSEGDQVILHPGDRVADGTLVELR